MQEFLLRNTSELLHIQDEKDQPQQVLSSQKLNNQYQFYQRMNDMYRSKQIQLQKNKNYQRINAQNYEAPRLPNKTSNKKYTLVLDIDETLVHTQFNGDKYKVIKRPFVQEFLQKLSIFYEIVTFTAGTKEYADSIINEHLDPENKWISHRLYRNNCKWFIDKSMNNERFCIKDVSKINRDINTVLIIDNIADNFSILQPFNGIEIFSYEGIFDRVLLNLIPILTYVAEKLIDIRSFIYTCIQGLKLKNLYQIVNKVSQQEQQAKQKYQNNSLSLMQESQNTLLKFIQNIISFFVSIHIFSLIYCKKTFSCINMVLAYFGLEILLNSSEKNILWNKEKFQNNTSKQEKINNGIQYQQ